MLFYIQLGISKIRPPKPQDNKDSAHIEDITLHYLSAPCPVQIYNRINHLKHYTSFTFLSFLFFVYSCDALTYAVYKM